VSPQVAPLVVGTLAILALAVYLASEMPAPGPLALAHAAVEDGERLPGCARCHAEDGLTAGCLACHGEIADQLRGDKGYHALLLRGGEPRCAPCHPDHLGADFDLLEVAWKEGGPGGFDHPHVDFRLRGRHEGLGCAECHTKPFALKGFEGHLRARTYLGLSQQCVSCHENVHKEERFLDCAGCHDQEEFRGATGFVHDKLPLVNGHRGVACGKCHLNEAERDYTAVRGTRCEECHNDPHEVRWGRDCESCHPRDATPWDAARKEIDPPLHARTGFPLAAPHDRAACAACHAEKGFYDERFRSPPRPPQSCALCHTDVHRGQFEGRGCLDCHAPDRWKPARVDHRTFPLRSAHEKALCAQCHRPDADGFQRFRGAPRACAGCHEDAHEGQFGKTSCDTCHTEKAFLPSLYDEARHTSFALTGAHRAVSCRACHADGRFKETPASCRACHTDPHGGQFAAEMKKGDCTACHRRDARTFEMRPFDHAARTGYTLEGAHAEATCARCHAERGGVRLYRGTSTTCAACHTDVHRGQFREARCEQCHRSREEWTARGFDHQATRFPLDRAHAPVACDRCHFTVRQPDGGSVVQYRPLPTECQSCHGFKQK
jgi:hypothetical protein